jgi:hypothetical protein
MLLKGLWTDWQDLCGDVGVMEFECEQNESLKETRVEWKKELHRICYMVHAERSAGRASR